MADYRLPMDADGVKYHGTVDQNEENPGHFMYGLDENGNKRIIRTDEQGNVLTRVTGSNVKDEDALPVKSRKVETYSSDRESFSIEVSPGSTYYASITFENGYITGYMGGDMRGYSKIAVGIQRQGGEHEYTLEVRSKAFGTNLSINQIEKRDGPDMVKLIEMELNYHSTSIRIINNSEEVQNYHLAVSAFPI